MNLDFNRICRLCLRFCEDYVDLCQTNGFKNLSSEITEKIKFCYFIQIEPSEGLPTKVCYQCIQVLTYFYVSKKNAVASEQMLRNIIYIKKKLEAKEVQGLPGSSETASPSDKLLMKHEKSNSAVQVKSEKESQNQNEESTTQVISKNIDSFQDTSKSFEINSKNEFPIHEEGEKESIELPFVKAKKKVKMKKDSELVGLNENVIENENKGLSKLRGNNSTNKLKIGMLSLGDLNTLTCKSSVVGQQKTEGLEGAKMSLTPPKAVKVIGTVIDQSNILSPDIKRARTTKLKR